MVEKYALELKQTRYTPEIAEILRKLSAEKTRAPTEEEARLFARLDKLSEDDERPKKRRRRGVRRGE